MIASPPPEADENGSLVLEQRFSIVPEWLIDAAISDSAFRLYAVLLRYGQTSGARMPSRATLAARLKKRSVDSVDRAMKELVAAGAVVVERRRRGRENLTNRYHVMTTAPSARRAGVSGQLASSGAAVPSAERAGGRISAATARETPGSRGVAARGGRAVAAGVAATAWPDPEIPTQSPPPPNGSAARRGSEALSVEAVADLCRLVGLDDVNGLVDQCRARRRRLGLPTARWTSRTVTRMLHRAVVEEDWPAGAAVPALLALAADPATQSPARLVHPGPWWDEAERAVHHRSTAPQDRAELAQLEAQLAEADGRRVWAQRRARDELTAAGLPVTRLEVARLACRLLAGRTEDAVAPSEPETGEHAVRRA